MLREFIKKVEKLVKKKKNIRDLTPIFCSPIEVMVHNINIAPEIKIEKKHQGHVVFKISSNI